MPILDNTDQDPNPSSPPLTAPTAPTAPSSSPTLPPPPDFGSIGSGGGSGGSTTTRRATEAEIIKAQFKNQLVQVYLGLHGEPPPPGYINRILNSGMNLYEFEAHERAKPSFRRSPRYAEERLSINLGIAQRLGFVR